MVMQGTMPVSANTGPQQRYLCPLSLVCSLTDSLIFHHPDSPCCQLTLSPGLLPPDLPVLCLGGSWGPKARGPSRI